MSCLTSAGAVQWYRLNRYDQDRNEAAEVKTGGKIDISTPGSSLLIFDVRVEDKGVYFCKMNDTWGPGTELQVVSKGTAARAAPPGSRRATANTLCSSPRTSEPGPGSAKEAGEGRPHHPPGSAAAGVHRRSDATQASAGEQSTVALPPGLHHSQLGKKTCTYFCN